MRFLRKAESTPLMKQKLFYGIAWMEEILSRQQVKRQAKKTRRELLKLGPHLLNDLGLNSKGYPLKPNRDNRIDT